MPRKPSRPPEPTGALPVPREWAKWIALRVPDYRAVIASWVDDLTRRKGLAVYEEMLYDPQVAASLDLLKFAALSLGFNVVPPKGKEQDKKVAKAVDFLENVIEHWPRGFNQFLYDTLSCIEYGYSITELIWDSQDSQWVVTDYLPLPQALYGFALDDSGRVIGVAPSMVLGTKEDQKYYPLDNFFILRWLPRYNAPYGRSQLRRAYEAWWMKQLLRRMRNTTLDRYGAPLMVVKVPDNTPEKDRLILKQFLENLYAEAGLVLNQTYDVQAVHGGLGQGSAEGFQRAIEYEDAQIAKAITGVTLNANEARGTGTYAQARVHQDTFLYWVTQVTKVLEDAINTQLIPKLVGYNFDLSPGDMPLVRFTPPEGEDIDLVLRVVQGASALGVVSPQHEFAWIRERLALPPASSEVAEAIAPKQSPMSLQYPTPQFPGATFPGTPSQEGEEQANTGQEENDSAWDQWWKAFVAASEILREA